MPTIRTDAGRLKRLICYFFNSLLRTIYVHHSHYLLENSKKKAALAFRQMLRVGPAARRAANGRPASGSVR